MKKYCAVFVVFVLLIFALHISVVKVEKVVDGDTFIADGKSFRLLGVDSPEKGQKCYEDAKNFLRKEIENKTVFVLYGLKKKDKYGRYLVYVFSGKEFINKRLIENGFAVYRDFGDFLLLGFLLPKEKYGCVKEIDTCEECIGISYFLWNPEGDDCKGGEMIKLKNFCDFACNLSGWVIENSKGERFVLNNTVLKHTLYIYSGCGEDKNTVYLCKKGCKAVWNNKGDTFILKTPEGQIVLNYSYKP